ncbi:hypothetical protein VKT23_015907, partial [Stygiomarasmius scandens]
MSSSSTSSSNSSIASSETLQAPQGFSFKQKIRIRREPELTPLPGFYVPPFPDSHIQTGNPPVPDSAKPPSSLFANIRSHFSLVKPGDLLRWGLALAGLYLLCYLSFYIRIDIATTTKLLFE